MFGYSVACSTNYNLLNIFTGSVCMAYYLLIGIEPYVNLQSAPIGSSNLGVTQYHHAISSLKISAHILMNFKYLTLHVYRLTLNISISYF